ncbi:MAG: pitrilysin family protein [Bacteroidia bacterium]|jgi:predicted Zn-dependent peptidase|nr:pitrilysin family protein [Bacteroidia bacterium]
MTRKLLLKPTVSPVDPGKIPEAVCVRLNNNIPVFLIEAGLEDLSRIEFTFGAGNAYEYLPLLASTTNFMLTEGTRNHTSSEINNALDFYGTLSHQYAENDRAGIVICVLNKHLDKILELAREILFFPVFPASELKTLIRKRLRKYLISREKVHNLALDKFYESIFGSHHPYGRQTLPDDFGKMIPLLLKDFHSGHYTPQNMAIIVSGKITEKLLKLLNNCFGEISPDDTYNEESCNVLESQKTKKVHIEKPGALQTAIRIGSPTIDKRHPDYPGLKVLNVLLGGYFGSRLMKNIREEKGLTYGIHSTVFSFNLSGYKVISTEVSKKSTQLAIDEIYKEIRLLQSVPVKKEEMEVVRNYMLGDMVRMFDGPFALAESFRLAWEFGLDNSYYYRLADKIKSIKADEIIALAQTYYNIDDLYEITAG